MTEACHWTQASLATDEVVRSDVLLARRGFARLRILAYRIGHRMLAHAWPSATLFVNFCRRFRPRRR